VKFGNGQSQNTLACGVHAHRGFIEKSGKHTFGNSVERRERDLVQISAILIEGLEGDVLHRIPPTLRAHNCARKALPSTFSVHPPHPLQGNAFRALAALQAVPKTRQLTRGASFYSEPSSKLHAMPTKIRGATTLPPLPLETLHDRAEAHRIQQTLEPDRCGL